MSSIDRLSVEAIMNEVYSNLTYFRDILAILGAVYATKICLQACYSTFRGFKVYVLPKLWNIKDFRSRYGEWAVITGASEGIGRAYSIELAKRGMNVVLMSRSYSKLEKVATEIEKNFNVQTKIVTVDFNDDECYGRVEEELEGLEVGVLVNNVGIMYERLQFFLAVSPERLKQIVNLNITATILMTRMILPQMVDRRRGAIINISSGACLHPTPTMTAYSASKICTDFFSRALNYEYKSKGVVIQSVQPFYVSTRMTNFMKPNFLVPDATTFVEHAVKTLPYTTRTFGYWSHGLYGVLGTLLPQWLYFWATIHVNLPLWHYFAGLKQED
eukprot:Seg160.1 transcript_id=Seg160.1/GoldUCD/mRNA.D3Y31 product="Hydroxysteroid dehydrogenase-like protein 1" protein_id=Seg160.1/GoldUCD/D3Y31